MSGQNESTTVDVAAKHKQRLDDLEAYAKRHAIPGRASDETNNEVSRILNLTPSQLKKLTAEECGEAAVMLTQFAFFIQQQVNREQSIIRWAEELIDYMLANQYNQYRGNSFQERKLKAIKENKAASKANTIRVEADLRCTRISFLSAKAEGMAKQISLLQQSKRNAHV